MDFVGADIEKHLHDFTSIAATRVYCRRDVALKYM